MFYSDLWRFILAIYYSNLWADWIRVETKYKLFRVIKYFFKYICTYRVTDCWIKRFFKKFHVFIHPARSSQAIEWSSTFILASARHVFSYEARLFISFTFPIYRKRRTNVEGWFSVRFEILSSVFLAFDYFRQ